MMAMEAIPVEFQGDNVWVQLGRDIDGDAGGDCFGCSVAIKNNGGPQQ